MSEQLDKLRKLTSRTWLNSGNSSAIVNESKDDEPGFLESAWGNFKGGAEGAICGIGVAGFTNLTALSTEEDPKKACRPFDKERNGFVMGDGSGILVLEELEHALARGAKIYGEVVVRLTLGVHVQMPIM